MYEVCYTRYHSLNGRHLYNRAQGCVCMLIAYRRSVYLVRHASRCFPLQSVCQTSRGRVGWISLKSCHRPNEYTAKVCPLSRHLLTSGSAMTPAPLSASLSPMLRVIASPPGQTRWVEPFPASSSEGPMLPEGVSGTQHIKTTACREFRYTNTILVRRSTAYRGDSVVKAWQSTQTWQENVALSRDKSPR